MSNSSLVQQRVNAFSSFDLSNEAIAEGLTFSLLQQQALQNLLSEEAHAKLGLEYDPANPQTFLQEEAYSRGKIDLLNYLLTYRPDYDAQQQADLQDPMY